MTEEEHVLINNANNMVCDLLKVGAKYKDKQIFTFDIRVSDMAYDAASIIARLLNFIKQREKEVK